MSSIRRQLKRVIEEEKLRFLKELHPRDVADAEYDQQLLNDLGGMYSDMYKELYRRRPNIPMFKTIEEAEAAVEELWGEYAAKNRAREAQEKADLEFIEMKRRRQELMPGEYDYEHVPKRSGMGRRVESRMRITKRQLRRIIERIGSSAPRSVLAERRAGGVGIGFSGWGPNDQPDFAKAYGGDSGAYTVEAYDMDDGEVYGDGGSARMAKSHLFNIARQAQSLQDRLSEGDELPEWVQSKIAVMADNMDAVTNHLDYKISMKEEDT